MSASGKEGCEQMSVCSATLEDFEKLDIRVGKVVEITPYPECRYSTHILLVNELGTKKSLAKLAPNYADSDVLGRQVLCVVNFPPRQIGKHHSEVLTLGYPRRKWKRGAASSRYGCATRRQTVLERFLVC
jgi:tRNA-binding protein